MAIPKLILNIIFLFISFACFSQNTILYYWDGPTKRNISVDSSQTIPSLSSDEYINLQSKGHKFEVVNTNQTYKVILKDFKLLSNDDKSRLAKRYGYAYFSNENHLSKSFIGDEISIKLKNPSSINYVSSKYELVSIQELRKTHQCQCRGTDTVLRTLAHLPAAHSRATLKQAKEPIISTCDIEKLDYRINSLV